MSLTFDFPLILQIFAFKMSEFLFHDSKTMFVTRFGL